MPNRRRDDELALLVGKRLKAVRKSRNMLQDGLAEAIGSDACEISQYETGRRIPHATSLVGICKTLDCSADWLLGLSE